MTSLSCNALPPIDSVQAAPIEHARAEMLQEGAYDQYLMTFDSHVRPSVFLTIVPQLTYRLYWMLLRDVWISAEVTMPEMKAWLMLLESKRPGREGLMSCSERRFLARLPDTVTIYRGCGHIEGVAGLSWTLNYERAKFFAAYACGPRRMTLCRDQHGMWPIMAKANCRKRDVLAYLSRRKEDEIIVDPTKIDYLGATEWRRPKRELATIPLGAS